ncbi:MAG: penicillin-insensitive murein endopeptidase [Thermodesulfobacteriota bacterium]
MCSKFLALCSAAGLSILLILLHSTVAAEFLSPWALIKNTTPGPSAAIGSVSSGCIAGAKPLPPQGLGFVNIRRQRNRYYGHPDTIQLVQDLGTALSKRTPELMMVGDLSQPRGGLMSSMHRSHQNGMDADIWFHLCPTVEQAKNAYPEKTDPASVVTRDGEGLNQEWGKQQRFLLKASADDARVDRIFVNPAIKRSLCRSENGDRSWLRKLRPWWGHDAHFHVRLKCPEESLDCRHQAPLPAGDGCDRSLDWWFSDAARTPAKKKTKGAKKKKPKLVVLEECKPLLYGI